ncbi:MAG: hypothetical protein IJ262_01840 [Clostridia bacterium]|nr:hypothetical protein [Clostridia bacterium]
MRNYFKRITDSCPKYYFIFWWLFRIPMIYAFVAGFFKEPFDITDPLQVGANFLCMFIWEIFMLFPEKSVFRHVSPGFQTFFIIGIFCASFGGKFMNFYYDVRWWDSALHFIGGAAAVFYGYELVCALMKKEKKSSSVVLVIIASVGFSFIASTLWELFEFSFDQVAGIMSGYPGDSQHWSLELALNTPKINTLFDPIVEERWPIMDIMGDIVLNTLGAALSYVILTVYPYRHKGKYKFDFEAKETALSGASNK